MKIRRFQDGGQMPVEQQPAAQPGAEQDPLMQIAQIFAQGLQEQNCEALAAGAEAFLMLLQDAQGGGEAPMGEPQGEPVFKKGGKLSKKEKGGKMKDKKGAIIIDKTKVKIK